MARVYVCVLLMILLRELHTNFANLVLSTMNRPCWLQQWRRRAPLVSNNAPSFGRVRYYDYDRR